MSLLLQWHIDVFTELTEIGKMKECYEHRLLKYVDHNYCLIAQSKRLIEFISIWL